MMGLGVDVIVPVKLLSRAKSRLRGAADGGIGAPAAHARLTLALARDTVAAAARAPLVRQVLVISSDPEVISVLAGDGAAVLAEDADRGLNAALEHAARVLRHSQRGSPPVPLGALQADLPALRADELDEALHRACALFVSRNADRAFCADASGAGTTLLVCGPHAALQPRFGSRSAAAHAAGGAVPMDGRWPGLRRDVDTVEDLWAAVALGLGSASSEALRTSTPSDPVARS
ncbi:MAG: 2-phospho-L-lactate guanylyltransferase [Actinomycetota bacterium]|nr:2-phospho-L-lactate guanylyltransferase [Actinomycetota bacterium]